VNWSVSTTKLFQSCPRKYYYQQILAKGDPEDPRTRESAELKQLNNLYAWRGSLVDGVISRFVVPKINKREPLDEDHIIAFAKFSLQDATLAAAYSQLAASALGLSSIWIGMIDEDKVMQIIGTKLRPSSILCIGYPQKKRPPKSRRKLKDLIHEL
jgi:nitroreductase